MLIYLDNICCGGIRSPHFYASEGTREAEVSDIRAARRLLVKTAMLYFVRSICENHLRAEGPLSSVWAVFACMGNGKRMPVSDLIFLGAYQNHTRKCMCESTLRMKRLEQ